jgi:hypothetical protein
MKKSTLRLLAAVTLSVSFTSAALALSPDDLLKAQKIIKIVLDLTAKYPAAAGNLTPPTPLTNQTGAYFLPYTSKGELTEWANKVISAQIGAAIGAKAGEQAGKALTSHIPGGGLFNSAIKNKSKEIGAVTAVGGTEFIKKTSDLSFDNLDDYAVYLHVKHSADADFASTLATVMTIYPALEKGYDAAIKSAYERAAKATTAAK